MLRRDKHLGCYAMNMNTRKADIGTGLWQRTAFLRSGAGLAILAVSFVGLRLLWIHVQRPVHLEENAALWGGIRDFSGVAQMNHDGSRFIYVAPANDRGHAVFLCDTITGKKQQIIEDKRGVGIWNDDFDCRAGPWSPDDRYFLCVVSNRPMVFSADTHQGQAVIDGRPFSEAVWLAPDEFVCVADKTSLCLAQQRADGQWEQKLIMSRNVLMTSLTAISSNTVAWLENGEVICRADLSGGDAPSPNNGGEAPLPPSATGASQLPTDGLALWLDASRLRQADQSPVLNLPDLSRSRNDAVWNGTPPVFNGTNSPRALNGRGTIHFSWLDSATNGTGLKTRRPIGITGATPRSVFVVMWRESDRPMMVSMGDTSAHGALFGVEWSEHLFLPTGWWADNYVDETSTNWNLLEVVYNGATQKGYLNGLLRCTASAKLNTVERGVEIGFRDGRDAKAAEGDFAELLVYDHALNAIERRQVEDYLQAKWFGQKSSSSQNAEVWYAPGFDGMTGLTYFREKGEFLISRTENGRDSIWRLSTASGASPIQVMQEQSLRDAQWAGSDRFVYASHDQDWTELRLADLSGKENKLLLESKTMAWFKVAPDQKQVFLLGSISNAPVPGIWRGDLASGAWCPVISSSDFPSPLAQAVIAVHKPMSLPGGNVTCTIYRPANFDKHKKYPLVIGDTMITDPIYGEPFMTGMAGCGAIVAVVERPWWTVGIEQWAQNVQGLYEKLKDDPAVDTSRVFVFAASAETYFLSQLVETNSAPWRGLILLNPGALPDFSKLSLFQERPKILLDAGGEEHTEDRFKHYQTNALNSGVVVEYYTYPGETHRTVGTDAKMQRSRELMRFIFEE
jgi:hypothetical protein